MVTTGWKAEAEADTPQPPSVLRTPAVARLVGTYGFSAVGSAMVAVAMAYVAYRESGSIVLTVVVVAANAAPALILSPLVGRLAVRYDPRALEVAGQGVKVALSVVLAAVAAAGDLTYGVLLAMNVANGIVSALIAPAWPRLIRMSAPEGRLDEVTAATSAAAAIAAIVGALAGGIVVAAVGATWVFVFNAVSYLPLMWAVQQVPGTASEPRETRGAVRAGVEAVRRIDRLREAFVLAAMLNLAAWPVLSVMPAVAQDVESHAHVLGLLVGAFYAGAAIVTWVVRRLRSRLPYGRILFIGFLGAGLLILGHAVLTAWRAPGYDAVIVAGITLIPIGLTVALDTSLLQALVQLSAPAEQQAPVLVVYATVTTVVTPIGGLVIGLLADEVSLWFALAFAGVCLTALALALRTRLRVFDDLGDEHEHPAPHAHHVHLIHLFGWDVARATIADASAPSRHAWEGRGVSPAAPR